MTENINQKALEKVCVAQPILNRILSNPQLANIQDPISSKLGDSRWDGHLVLDTLSEIINLYGAEYYNSIANNGSIPQEVKDFVRDAYNYKFKLSI